MIESFVHAKNGLRELGLCGEGEWRAKKVVSRVEEITSGRDDDGRHGCGGGGGEHTGGDICRRVQVVG
jgi:hypothetical protein